MNFNRAVQSCFRQYATFSGRASRSEYLYFNLFNLLALCVLLLMTVGFSDLALSNESSVWVLGFSIPSSVIGALSMAGVFALITALPNWTVSVRRLHDTDKSGWWLLLGLLPYVGGLLVMILLILPGSQGPNRYGEAHSA